MAHGGMHFDCVCATARAVTPTHPIKDNDATRWRKRPELSSEDVVDGKPDATER